MMSQYVQRLVSALPSGRATSRGWTARCPGHEDATPSLSVWEGRDGRAMFSCHAGCPKESILAKLGLTWSDVSPSRPNPRQGGTTRTAYRIPHAGRVYEHVRIEGPNGKSFAWRTDGMSGLQGLSVTDLPPYRSEYLVEGEASPPVIIVEGEKAADALSRIGATVVATFGAGTVPSAAALSGLRERPVVLWPDNDEPGRSHMEKVGKALGGIARSVSVMAWPEAPPKGDAADFVAGGGTPEQLSRLVGQAHSFVASAFLGWSAKPTNPTRFRPLSLPELRAETPTSIEWLWAGFVPRGSLILLSGLMKGGKSTFAYAMIAAIAAGRPFLGQPTKKTKTLILAVEEHGREALRRLERFAAPDDAITVHRGPLTVEDLPDVRRFVEGTAVGLLVIDTWLPFADIADENSNAEISRKIAPVLALARETNCAVVLVVHDRKSGGDDGRSIRGAGSLLGAADQALLLTRKEGGAWNQRVLRVIGRFEDSPASTVIELKDSDYLALGTSREIMVATNTERVSGALTPTPQTVREIATAAALSEGVVRKTLDGLGPAVVRTGTGKRNEAIRYSRPDSLVLHSTLGGETQTNQSVVEEFLA